MSFRRLITGKSKSKIDSLIISTIFLFNMPENKKNIAASLVGIVHYRSEALIHFPNIINDEHRKQKISSSKETKIKCI